MNIALHCCLHADLISLVRISICTHFRIEILPERRGSRPDVQVTRTRTPGHYAFDLKLSN